MDEIFEQLSDYLSSLYDAMDREDGYSQDLYDDMHDECIHITAA